MTIAERQAAIAEVQSRIVPLRGQRIMLSSDLADLYGVERRVLIQAVKRNAARFPDDFCFQLTREELVGLRSRTVISSWGGARTPPYAFTEQGVAMLSSVLRSDRAIAVNIEIMRTFVKLRAMLESNEDLAKKLESLEQKYDDQFQVVFDAIRELMSPPTPSTTKRIGFIQD